MRKLCLLMGLAILLASCGADPSASAPTFVPPTFAAMPTPSPLIGRTTMLVTRGDLVDTISVRGEMVAEPQVTLAFPIGGILVKINAEPGAFVEKGEILAELDAVDLQRAAIESASNLAVAELELAQEKALRSEVPYAVEIAEERVSLKRALDAYAKAQVEKTKLVAPFSGTLVNFAGQVGDAVRPYDTIAVLADGDNLMVRVMLPVATVARVDVGDAVALGLDGQSNHVYAGTVAAIASVARPVQGQSVQDVTIRFDAGQDVPPLVGVGVDVRIVDVLRENVLLVPTDAVVTVAGQTYLDVLTDEGVIARTPAAFGVTAGGAVEILSGVDVGQTIVLP